MLATLLVAAPASAAPELVDVGAFSAPVQVAAPPGDPRLFVAEQGGRIEVLGADGALEAQPFLDVGDDLLGGAERGLLGLAFAPDYATSGEFFVYLTARPAGEIQIRRYEVSAADPDRADAASGVIILRQDHDDFPNHNGGGLRFGPDGKLWASLGDGGGGDDTLKQAQDRTSLLGKLLRLERDGSAVAANPFLGEGTDHRIFHYGLRNAFRFSFDRTTGDLIIADVGQSRREEVDVAPLAQNWLPGANWGWPCFEGTLDNVQCTAPGAREPVLETDHDDDGAVAIAGGVVVRDPGLPSLAGRYVFGDLAFGELHSADLATGTTRAEDALRIDGAVSIDEDGCGRVLATSIQGRVARLVDGAPSACPAYSVPPPPEPQECGLTASVPRQRHRKTLLRRGVRVRVRVLAPCAIKARPRVGRRLGPIRRAALIAGERRTLRLRLGGTKRALKGRLHVRVRATAGRVTVRELRVRVSP